MDLEVEGDLSLIKTLSSWYLRNCKKILLALSIELSEKFKVIHVLVEFKVSRYRSVVLTWTYRTANIESIGYDWIWMLKLAWVSN